ncbi:MAG: glycoside hydrolase family 3 N-terminal domain-containing protein [Corynebacterium sp.]|uniref:glycoside hydrolase family 3 N-terminal domain-containing protein n=1 Tax=Corynebacterium sp. TaxID=1720 RepID=UPI003F9B47F4
MYAGRLPRTDHLRTRIPAAVLAVTTTVALAACSDDGGGQGATTTPAPSAVPSTATTAAGGPDAAASPSPDAGEDTSCGVPDDLAQLAGASLAVGVNGFDDAAAAVDAGVRHIFIGSGTDLGMLDGQGDPARSISALKDMARGTGGELTVSVDEEGGQVQRLAGIIGELPSAREIAGTMDPGQARGLFAEHGRKMAGLGITMDFAPVVDLAGGDLISDNAIGDRAFSDDPQVVADYAGAAVDGLQDAGISPVIKHFPGHGHATGDSHHGTVSTPPLDQLGPDLEPFAALANRDGVGVMVGHMQTPGLDAGEVLGQDTPASLNPAAYGLLRDGVSDGPGFDGVIFTDDLTGMQAITDTHSGPEAVVAALRAGADAPLTSTEADVQATVDGLVAAVENGDLDRGRLEGAAGRHCSA